MFLINFDFIPIIIQNIYKIHNERIDNEQIINKPMIKIIQSMIHIFMFDNLYAHFNAFDTEILSLNNVNVVNIEVKFKRFYSLGLFTSVYKEPFLKLLLRV